MGRVSGIQGAQKGPPGTEGQKDSAAAVQTPPDMAFCRHSHSVHRPGDPSLCVALRAVRLRPPPARASISASARHRVEVLEASLVHRHRPPRRQEPATPSWTVAFFSSSSHLEARWPLLPLRRPPLQSSRGTSDRSTHLEPRTSHFPPSLPPPASRHRRPTESTRRRPSSSISHPAFFTLTTIAFPTSIHGRNHQSTHSIARPPATHPSPRGLASPTCPPSPLELSTVARVRAWGSANPRNAVQGHTWCEACHDHALPRCRSPKSRRLPRSTSALKMPGTGTSPSCPLRI